MVKLSEVLRLPVPPLTLGRDRLLGVDRDGAYGVARDFFRRGVSLRHVQRYARASPDVEPFLDVVVEQARLQRHRLARVHADLDGAEQLARVAFLRDELENLAVAHIDADEYRTEI